jgi:hypothetical protein
MQAIQQFPTWFSKQKLIGKLTIGCGGLFLLLCVCSSLTAVFRPSTPTPETADVASIQTAAFETALAGLIQPTIANTPASTEPTQTPLPPTATEDPNLIKAGTFLVGAEIQPGIYRGYAGNDLFTSCYWARMKDFSGGLEALLANDNSIGQYYIEVRAGDQGLKTDCDLVPLASLPAPTEFPQVIQPGMYLVGRDVQPGTYRGEAGTDFSDSCYWARLSNVAGELDGILANDNATGQYYVQVTASDFALSTGCQLERIGD